MSLIESQLLSKILDEKNFYVLRKYNIDENDFQAHKDVFLFIRQYVKEQGTVPDFRTVVTQFPDFDYLPGVTDTFKYLCTSLKSRTAKRRAFEILQHQAGDMFKNLSGAEFVRWLKNEVDQLSAIVDVTNTTGTNYATNGKERKQWYEEMKVKRSGQYIPTPYPSLTQYLGGGFELGDYILLMAFTNRGKSWLASQMGAHAWLNGFGVLHYSPELTKRQQSARLDTLIGHFNNVALRRGKLENEEDYFRFLEEKFSEKNEVPYIIKTMEDLPEGLSLEVIEADLQMNENIQMVIIDGFNLMDHGGGKMREKMTQTSRRLRQLFGRYNVAGLVVHHTPGQAERENKEEDELGNRIVKPPELDDYSETIAVIQDAATVLTFDQHDGIGKILIAKAREPHVGEVIELSCNFNLGYIQEASPVDYF